MDCLLVVDGYRARGPLAGHGDGVDGEPEARGSYGLSEKTC